MTFWRKIFLALCIASFGAYILFPIWTFRTPDGHDYAAPEYVQRFITNPPPNPTYMPGYAAIDYERTFLSALVWIFRGLILYAAFTGARRLVADGYASPSRAYIATFGVVLFLTLIAWSTYGAETDDDDYGRADTVVAFNPTLAQRNRHGLRVFFFLAIPAFTGTYFGLRLRNQRSAEETVGRQLRERDSQL
jgi:hypothetical protein